MDNLDFSALTDDQLVGLLRAILQEAMSRNPAVVAAMRTATLDEQEKIQIIRDATDREAAKLRAQERERVAKEAAERVRMEHAAQEAEVARLRALDASQRAVSEAAACDEAKRNWLRRASAIVAIEPPNLSLCYIKSPYGRRVLLNEGGRYSREHLADWNRDSNTIKTSRKLMGRKAELIALCAEFAASPGGVIEGSELVWEEEPCQMI